MFRALGIQVIDGTGLKEPTKQARLNPVGCWRCRVFGLGDHLLVQRGGQVTENIGPHEWSNMVLLKLNGLVVSQGPGVIIVPPQTMHW